MLWSVSGSLALQSEDWRVWSRVELDHGLHGQRTVDKVWRLVVHVLDMDDHSLVVRICKINCLFISMGRVAMTTLEGIWKNRGITWTTKLRLVRALVFPIFIYGVETILARHRKRIDAFEMWCWRRMLRMAAVDCKTHQCNNSHTT